MSLDSLKPFVNDPLLWKSFQEYVEGKIAIHTKTLINSTGVELLAREQGKIQALYKLLSLRDEVNGLDARQAKLL